MRASRAHVSDTAEQAVDRRPRRSSAVNSTVPELGALMAAGNRTLSLYLAGEPTAQRLYLGAKPRWDADTTVPKAKLGPFEVGTGKRGDDLRAIDDALAGYGTPGQTRSVQLQTLSAAVATWLAGKVGKGSQRRHMVQTLQQEVNAKVAYFGSNAFKYRNPPLTEADARALLTRIENGDATALNGLLGPTRQYAKFDDQQAPWEHEWGLGVDLVTNEAYLIPGDNTGVVWTVHNPYVSQVAHSHPYFTHPGEPGGRDRRGDVGTKTKEIADHNGQPGMVRWTDLTGNTENREMLKIFPSGSDVVFAAKKGVSPHTVFTTYVLDGPPVQHVGNPTSASAGGPLLSFEIVAAAQTGNPDIATCTLRALANGMQFWSKDNVTGDVTVDATGVLNL